MTTHTCHHCKQWVAEGEAHDCWTTTEQALTRDLPEDLREAWERLREVLGDLGEQRIYASHSSIMFARRVCYAFVRPKLTRLEVCFFLGRAVSAPQVKSSTATSRVKVAHMVHVRHRDEVEAPLTDWLREAYDVSESLSRRTPSAPVTEASNTSRPPSRPPSSSAARRRQPAASNRRPRRSTPRAR